MVLAFHSCPTGAQTGKEVTGARGVVVAWSNGPRGGQVFWGKYGAGPGGQQSAYGRIAKDRLLFIDGKNWL